MAELFRILYPVPPTLTGSSVAARFQLYAQISGGHGLSRAKKTRHLVDLRPGELDPVDPSRRDFVVRCCQGASGALVSTGLRALGFPSLSTLDSRNTVSSDGHFHLHPHYRAQTPLDSTLLKTQAGLDNFVTEKYHDQIAAILAKWSSGLLRSPQEVQELEKALAADFSASSLRPVESRLLRSGPSLQIRKNKFTRQIALGKEAFLQELRSALSP